jgi:hypothetical protein
MPVITSIRSIHFLRVKVTRKEHADVTDPSSRTRFWAQKGCHRGARTPSGGHCTVRPCSACECGSFVVVTTVDQRSHPIPPDVQDGLWLVRWGALHCLAEQVRNAATRIWSRAAGTAGVCALAVAGGILRGGIRTQVVRGAIREPRLVFGLPFEHLSVGKSGIFRIRLLITGLDAGRLVFGRPASSRPIAGSAQSCKPFGLHEAASQAIFHKSTGPRPRLMRCRAARIRISTSLVGRKRQLRSKRGAQSAPISNSTLGCLEPWPSIAPTSGLPRIRLSVRRGTLGT